MNLATLAPEWALWGLIALLALAALHDAIMLKISNYLVLGILILAVITAVVVGPRLALWENLAVFAVALTIGTIMFGRGWAGGGDIKLFSATALWFDFGGSFRFLLATAICGGILALLILLLRMIPVPETLRARIKVLQKGGGIPYGIAIAAGAIVANLMLDAAAPNPMGNVSSIPSR